MSLLYPHSNTLSLSLQLFMVFCIELPLTLVGASSLASITHQTEPIQKCDHVIGGWNAGSVKLNFSFLTSTLINMLTSAPHFPSKHGPLWINRCRW